MTTTTGWTARWILFYKSFGKITTKVFTPTFRKSFIRRIFAYKGSFDFGWITHRQSDGHPILCGENILRRTWYQQRLRADLYFSIGKITMTLTTALIHSFRVWYVQCLAKRLTMNLIEFIHLKVWRSFDSLAGEKFIEELDNNDIGRAFTKSNGFRFKTV